MAWNSGHLPVTNLIKINHFRRADTGKQINQPLCKMCFFIQFACTLTILREFLKSEIKLQSLKIPWTVLWVLKKMSTFEIKELPKSFTEWKNYCWTNFVKIFLQPEWKLESNDHFFWVLGKCELWLEMTFKSKKKKKSNKSMNPAKTSQDRERWRNLVGALCATWREAS